MALHKDFPASPYVVLDPAIRWFPADESLRDTSREKLMPPLVSTLRKRVQEFRNGGYVGATETSRTLLNWWFVEPHLIEQARGEPSVPFQYFFAQREALETIVYLTDVAGVKDKHDLMRFDSSGAVSSGMFDESWRRFVIKMATGSGKTKVLSLALAWSFFCKTYEPDSTLSRNFLLIAPNIIVLDRIYKDFQGLRIFFQDPVIPDNGYEGRNWRDDFQLTLHLQDEVRVTRPTGNIFLTNIHRVYAGNEAIPSADDEDTMDYFLGKKPTGGTTDNRADLGKIVRDIDELMVLNDEAHHVHDAKMAWFTSIQDIHNRLVQKGDTLSLQIDVTATPKRNNGAIFVQTVSDYPLVEAISQNVVKHPVLPDAASRGKLTERKSIKYTERYVDYLDLGVIEWRKAFEEHAKVGKKAVLFVMTDDTKNCDEVAEYLRGHYPDLAGDATLVIHTKSNGDISESTTGKAKEELEELRKQANSIDDAASPARAIVSVMMLKEGWDVRNVTTIVGLRAYNSKAAILPEQTLGRGLRKMYPGEVEEYVSVIGTEAFMDFVESIKAEGVILERKAMGQGTGPKAPLVVEVEQDGEKELDELDIEIPVLTPRVYREYKNLAHLDVSALVHPPVEYHEFTEDEQREIVFKDIASGEIKHTTILDTAGVADYRSVMGYFAHTIMRDLRLVSGYDALYPKIKTFVRDHLFGREVDLESPNTLRNLSELAATKALIEAFKKGVNDLTVSDKGDAQIRDTIRLRDVRPFVAKDQGYIVPKKSLFNRIIGDGQLELEFAEWLDRRDDVKSFAKNYFAVNFRLDYVRDDGSISNYYPDFIVRLTDGRTVIVETKGVQDVDVAPKMRRLRQWCEDVNTATGEESHAFVYVDQESFEKYKPKSMAELLTSFREFQ